MPEKRKYSERELDGMHAGKGYKKGLRAEAGRELKEHQRSLLAILLAFILGALFGALMSRRRE